MPEDFSKWGDDITATTFKKVDKAFDTFDICKEAPAAGSSGSAE